MAKAVEQPSSWVDAEFGAAQLGDARLSARLIQSADILAAQPGRAFCAAAVGNKAAIKGYYRMIDKPEESGVTPEAILAPHRQRTIERMSEHEVVLCIQDGSELNYSGLSQCEGLGRIGTNQTGASSAGLHLHSTFVVSPQGVPLGVLRAALSAPQPKTDKRKSQAVAIEQKKTFAWIEGLRDCVSVSERLGSTRQVCLMDREADFFELFQEPRSPTVQLLVRAKHDRVMGEQELSLFEQVRKGPVQAELQLKVPRQSARTKKSKQQGSAGHGARTAQVELRWVQLQLRPPAHLKGREPLWVWVVHVREPVTPEDDQPLEWFLLSTRELSTASQAEECLGWYCLRWRIEDWHRVLKTGCRIESMQYESATRLRRAIAIHLVIAWRIMLMTLLGRQSPDLPAQVLFCEQEIEVLSAFAKQQRIAFAPRLHDAVRLVARLGGYIERGNQPPPGHLILWRGYRDLQIMCNAFALRD